MRSKGTVISLASRTSISRGSFRDCYVHPDDDSRCIKIARLQPSARSSQSNPNLREMMEYERLLSAGAPVQRYFAEVYGLVETDLGPGLCVERLRGLAGEEPVPTVVSAALKKLQSGLSVSPIKKGIEELMTFCIEYEILASCQELKNIGVVGRNGAEAVMGYDVKVMPNNEFIPISTYSSYFRRRKVERRFRRTLLEFEGILERAMRSGEYGRASSAQG
jgi:hypothetical protein